MDQLWAFSIQGAAQIQSPDPCCIVSLQLLLPPERFSLWIGSSSTRSQDGFLRSEPQLCQAFQAAEMGVWYGGWWGQCFTSLLRRRD